MLNSDQKNVLFALIHDPRFNLNTIKSYLDSKNIKISYYSIKKAYEDLHKNNILRDAEIIADPVVPGGRRMISEVEGNYQPDRLGLQRYHVIFYKLPNTHAVDLFKKACDEHPYTHYRTLLIGDGMNGYAQFDIPIGLKIEMFKFYEELSEILGCSEFEVLKAERSTRSDLKLDKYNAKDGKWDFNIFGENSLESLWNDRIDKQANKYLVDQSISLLSTLKYIDLRLIRELTINANVKAADIHKYYKKDRTTISRYLSRLKSDIMTLPTLYYDRLKFDMSSPQLITGTVESPRILNLLHQIYEQNEFPFRSELISEGAKFMMILMVPPSVAPEISYFIWSKVNSMKIYNISVSVDSAKKYPFYHMNFDELHVKWRTDKEYIINNVIKVLKTIQ